MRKLKIYLDTSIINFLYAEDAPVYMKITEEFFNDYLLDYEVYISEVVFIEINRTKDEVKRNQLFSVLDKYQITVYDILNEEIEELAGIYMSEKVIPENKIDDAMHVAFSTYFEFDILLSWNFRHLANIKKQMKINSINEREGYSKKLLLLNPMEVFYEKWIWKIYERDLGYQGRSL